MSTEDRIGDYIDVVFDGPPDHHMPRFVELEDSLGHSMRLGEWVERGDGTWSLRIRHANLEETLAELYGSEINASISWLWDSGFNIALGDDLNGFRAKTTVTTLAEAADWFRDNAIRLYPDSQFARKYRDKEAAPSEGRQTGKVVRLSKAS